MTENLLTIFLIPKVSSYGYYNITGFEKHLRRNLSLSKYVKYKTIILFFIFVCKSYNNL